MNTPVNFELAKLLKEKGYDIPSLKCYLEDGSVQISSGDEGDFETIIQSLSQPKITIGFECEMEETFTDGYTEDRVRRFYSKKPKKTTNTQGQTVWVGKYIYND